MAPSNRPSKDKRQRENRARREARAARSARAGEATAIARGEREAAATQTGSSGRATGKDGGAPADRQSARQAARERRNARWSIKGHRAVVLAFLFTLVSAGTLLFAPIQVERVVTDEDDPLVEELDDEERQTLEDEGEVEIFVDGKLTEEESAPVVAMVLVLPIAITGAAALVAKRDRRATYWSMAMIALAAYIFFLSGPYGVISLPSLIALAVGSFQARRAETKERLAELRAQQAAKAARGDDGEVIDTEATEVEHTADDTGDDTGLDPDDDTAVEREDD